eukprot:1962416-Prymnesium_polylepis.1
MAARCGASPHAAATGVSAAWLVTAHPGTSIKIGAPARGARVRTVSATSGAGIASDITAAHVFTCRFGPRAIGTGAGREGSCPVGAKVARAKVCAVALCACRFTVRALGVGVLCGAGDAHRTAPPRSRHPPRGWAVAGRVLSQFSCYASRAHIDIKRCV